MKQIPKVLADIVSRRSIAQTLFVVMTGVALVVVIVMAMLISRSLEQGFKDHIQTTELNHLTAVEKTLVYYYQKNGNWQFLQSVGSDFAAGMGRLADSVPGLKGNVRPGDNGTGVGVHDFEVLQGGGQARERMPPPEAVNANEGGGAWTPVDTPQGADQPASPLAANAYGGGGAWAPVAEAQQRADQPSPPQMDNRQENRPPPRPADSGGRNDIASIGQRMAVLDVDGDFLAGNPHPEMSPRRAIYLTNNGQRQLIGYLVLAKPLVTGDIQTGSDNADQRFINEQIRNILWISVLAIIISALAALLLARYFRQPIKELADGARQVAAGDFSIRLPVNRRDELGAVAHDFNQMAEQLGSFERSRRQWVADTSHELRTPITILSTHLEAMADGIIPTSNERLGVLSNTVADMNRLVGDLHQLASADAGARDYQFQPVDVGDLLVDLERAFAARLQQQQLSLQVVDKTPVGLRIEADRLRLTQVLANLLTNSSRYTDAGGQVRIMATMKAESLTFIIEDSAPGVPAQALPRLFDRFYRVDASRSRQNGGSGLGLAICQAIVDAHHGVIVASASLLGGLRVEISLPLARTEQVTA